MRNKIILYINISFYVLFLLLFCYTAQSWIQYLQEQREINLRASILKRWYNETKAYTHVEKVPPNNLYDVAKHQWIDPNIYMNVPDSIYLGSNNRFSSDREKKKLREYEYFTQKTKYEFISMMHAKWIIIEKATQDKFPFFLLIDQDGDIHKLEFLKRTIDHSKWFLKENPKQIGDKAIYGKLKGSDTLYGNV